MFYGVHFEKVSLEQGQQTIAVKNQIGKHFSFAAICSVAITLLRYKSSRRQRLTPMSTAVFQ